MSIEMRRKLPNHVQPVALFLGVLLSGIVMTSDSALAVGVSLVLLASALVAFEGPALLKNAEDEAE